jgi:hypothetical protein
MESFAADKYNLTRKELVDKYNKEYTKSELYEYCKINNISGCSKLKKADLVEIVINHKSKELIKKGNIKKCNSAIKIFDKLTNSVNKEESIQNETNVKYFTEDEYIPTRKELEDKFSREYIKSELYEYCKINNISGCSKLKKADLVEIVINHILENYDIEKCNLDYVIFEEKIKRKQAIQNDSYSDIESEVSDSDEIFTKSKQNEGVTKSDKFLSLSSNSFLDFNDVDFENVNSFKHSIINAGDVSFLFLNIHSILKNFDKLKECLNKEKVKYDVIVLVETWLKEEPNIMLDGYKCFNSLSVRRSDGVTVFLKNNYNVISTDKLCINDSNSIEIHFIINSTHFCCTGIYKRPRIHNSDFIDGLETYLNKKKNVETKLFT